MMSRVTTAALIALGALAAPAGARQGAVMTITGCNLGCSSGGASVSCAISNVFENGAIEVRFSRPIDPASIDFQSFRVVDVVTASAPPGSLVFDPGDPMLLRWVPDFVFDAQGNLSYGLQAGHTYRVFVQGQLAGDAGPFVQSFDGLPNLTRLMCSVTAFGVSSTPGNVSCRGFGAGAGPCPCGPSRGGRGGCPSSANVLGGELTLYDVQTSGPGGQRFSFVGSSLPLGVGPGSPVVLFRGPATTSPTAFGDGLLCAATPVVRVFTGSSGGGVIGVAPLQHVDGPGSFTYQLWCRDSGAWCTASLFNATNAVELTWP